MWETLESRRMMSTTTTIGVQEPTTPVVQSALTVKEAAKELEGVMNVFKGVLDSIAAGLQTPLSHLRA